MTKHSVWPVVLLLGAAQTIAWASTFYLPAAIGAAVAKDTGLTPTTFFGLVTVALIISALLGPEVGRLTDRWGGRIMLAASTVPITFGLIILAQAQGIVTVGLAWLILSIGMALGLYEVSAAAMAHIFKGEARRAIA
ncbi:MAG: MFS transporter, partial [Proteobacteria bacterium]|nr:MFS transporter [Pseudomonadota bacterium]